MKPIQQQIEEALISYVHGQMTAVPDGTKLNGETFAQMLGAALLTGISLTSAYLSGNDGSDTITPQAIERAVQEVARRAGLHTGKLAR